MKEESVTSTAFQKGFRRYRETALSRPVVITHNNQDSLVLMAADEYRRLKRRDRLVMGLDDFTEADLAAIEAGGMDPGADVFDGERND